MSFSALSRASSWRVASTWSARAFACACAWTMAMRHAGSRGAIALWNMACVRVVAQAGTRLFYFLVIFLTPRPIGNTHQSNAAWVGCHNLIAVFRLSREPQILATLGLVQPIAPPRMSSRFVGMIRSQLIVCSLRRIVVGRDRHTMPIPAKRFFKTTRLLAGANVNLNCREHHTRIS
jgi:hypothetical protein